jgi:hypothetical protein
MKVSDRIGVRTSFDCAPAHTSSPRIISAPRLASPIVLVDVSRQKQSSTQMRSGKSRKS